MSQGNQGSSKRFVPSGVDAQSWIGFEHRIFKTPGHRVFLVRALFGLESYVQQLGTVTNWHRLFADAVAAATKPRARVSRR